jgi:hypothetical protein
MYFSIYVVGFMDYNGYMWSIKCLTDEKSMQFMLYWENGRQGVTWEMFTTQGSLQWLIFSINDLLTLLRCLYNTAKGRTLTQFHLGEKNILPPSAMPSFISKVHCTPVQITLPTVSVMSCSFAFTSRRATDQQPASLPESSLAWLLQWKFADFGSAVVALLMQLGFPKV